MKRENGIWYYHGKGYATFREALRAAWPERVPV